MNIKEGLGRRLRQTTTVTGVAVPLFLAVVNGACSSSPRADVAITFPPCYQDPESKAAQADLGRRNSMEIAGIIFYSRGDGTFNVGFEDPKKPKAGLEIIQSNPNEVTLRDPNTGRKIKIRGTPAIKGFDWYRNPQRVTRFEIDATCEKGVKETVITPNIEGLKHAGHPAELEEK